MVLMRRELSRASTASPRRSGPTTVGTGTPGDWIADLVAHDDRGDVVEQLRTAGGLQLGLAGALHRDDLPGCRSQAMADGDEAVVLHDRRDSTVT